MQLLRLLLRLAGLAIAGYSLLIAASATMFRIDSQSDLEFVLTADMLAGFGIATGAFFALPAIKWRSARVKALAVVLWLFVWAAVSGPLIWWHCEQVRVRWRMPELPTGQGSKAVNVETSRRVGEKVSAGGGPLLERDP